MSYTIEDIAIACHEMNRLYCRMLGDTSHTFWSDAPTWQRESAREGVQNILDGLVTTPEESHVNWAEKKYAEGWVYGPEKDADEKTHPCMVTYDQLPASQRAKDYIFFAVVKGMRGDL